MVAVNDIVFHPRYTSFFSSIVWLFMDTVETCLDFYFQLAAMAPLQLEIMTDMLLFGMVRIGNDCLRCFFCHTILYILLILLASVLFIC